MNRSVRKVLICSNYAWTVYNFRLPLIRYLIQNGYQVEVLTQFDGYEREIKDEISEVHPLFISRKGMNPFIDLFTLLDFYRKLIYIKPDVVLCFTIKPVIYGSIASRVTKIPTVAMITGLGTTFLMDNWVTKAVTRLYRFALKKVSIVLFQNTADRDLFVSQKMVSAELAGLVPGSGIDLNKYAAAPYPMRSEVIFLFVGRILWDKGVGEFAEAAKSLKHKYPSARFQMLGPLDAENRTAIDAKTVQNWVEEGFIEYLGEADDVVPYMHEASCVVLPSYREGTSRVLLEAASLARPIVATDVPGCREVVEDAVSGYLCEVKSPVDLAEKMEKMINLSPAARADMGSRGRRKMVEEFDQKIVFKKYLDTLKALGL